MAAVLFVLGGMILLFSGVKAQFVYRSIVDSLPPQFQDDLSSRYAFPVYALSSSTPLPLQAEYVKSMLGFCISFLCLSLGFFAARNVVFGCFLLVWFVWGAFVTIKSWKTYRTNCEQPLPQDEEEIR
jgi:hypothetical protein